MKFIMVKKVIEILFNASIYYVIFRLIVWLIFILNWNLGETVNYHYSDSLIWYFLWFIFPITTSILISIKLQANYLRRIGVILLPALIIGTVISGYLNNNYWGYWFKRPTVFKELKEASSIVSITDINKPFGKEDFVVEIDSNRTKELYGRKNLYYGNFDRPIMTFQDKAHIHPELYDWFEITIDSSKKINNSDLLSLTRTILGSHLLVQPKTKSYNESTNRLKGKIIEFKTLDNKSFYHIALTSGEVSNDHYPFYEFLIEKNDKIDIKNNQIFYTDVAGIEGFEYMNIIGLFEFFLLLIIGILVLLFNSVKLIIKGKKAITLYKKS